MKRKIVHIEINEDVYKTLKIYCVNKNTTIKDLVKTLVLKKLMEIVK